MRIVHWLSMLMLIPAFHLGMSIKDAQSMCPKPLGTVYEMLHAAKYLSCDDGKNTTILVFSNDKAIAIMDVKYFATIPGV